MCCELDVALIVGEPGSFENEKNKSVSTIPFITGRE